MINFTVVPYLNSKNIAYIKFETGKDFYFKGSIMFESTYVGHLKKEVSLNSLIQLRDAIDNLISQKEKNGSK